MIIVGEIETAKEKSLFCHVMCHEERSEMLRPHIHVLSEYSCSPWHLSCQKLNLKLWPPSHHTTWAKQSLYFTRHFRSQWICKSNILQFLKFYLRRDALNFFVFILKMTFDLKSYSNASRSKFKRWKNLNMIDMMERQTFIYPM